MTAENSSVQLVADILELGTPTYCTPGRPGRVVVPGLLIGAACMAFRVGSAKGRCGFLVGRVFVRRCAGARRDGSPTAGGLGPGQPRCTRGPWRTEVLPGGCRVFGGLGDRERPAPEPTGGLGLVRRREGEAVLALHRAVVASSSRRPRSRRTTWRPCRPCTGERHSLKLELAASFSPAAFTRST